MKFSSIKGYTALTAAALILGRRRVGGSCRDAIMVRTEEGDDRLSRWLWRQQLAPDHDGFRQGGSPKVPQYHRL